MQLETINKLFLELSQVATAKTAHELVLEREIAHRDGVIAELRAQLPAKGAGNV